MKAMTAAASQTDEDLELRADAWRAELAYFQGRYSAAEDIIDGIVDKLSTSGPSLGAAELPRAQERRAAVHQRPRPL